MAGETYRDLILAEIIRVRDESPRLANDADSEEIADAVLAVMADVEGIAGVLITHRFIETDEERDCECYWLGPHGPGSSPTLLIERQKAHAIHQAEAVAAHILGQS